MRVHLGSDHAGFELKHHIIEHLRPRATSPSTAAPTYDARDDYPPFCIATGLAVLADPGSLGIVIGGSGNGEQIAANKVPGIRAALAWSIETAKLARQHNNAQVVAIGGRHALRSRRRPRSPTRSWPSRSARTRATSGASTCSPSTRRPTSRPRFRPQPEPDA